MENKFRLCHVVLYAKGWYHKTDDIFRDLRFALNLDGYSGDHFSNDDIVYMLLSECDQIKKTSFKTSEIYFKIRPRETYLYGYIHNQSPDYFKRPTEYKDYDFNLAIIYYILSKLRFLNKSEWVIDVGPIYGKGLGKPYRIKKSEIEEIFGHFN